MTFDRAGDGDRRRSAAKSQDYDSDTVASLKHIARSLRVWKFTALYIAAVLTLWMILIYTGRV